MAKKRAKNVIGTQPGGKLVRKATKKQQAENARQLGGLSKRAKKGYHP